MERRSKSVRDPVHGYIEVEPALLPLVDSPLLQRLRLVRQLGFAYLVYPGANHTRFEHSLGAMHLAGRLCRHLTIDPELTRAVTAAALLHDVGHGPFSHVSESFLIARLGRAHQEIRGIVEASGAAGLLEEVSVDPGEVCRLVAGDHPLAGIIQGELDVDRMDYLLRDAHFAGVSYGKFDLERMLRVLRPAPNQMVVKQSGMHSIEDYIMRRYQMYWQVYLHPVTRSSDYLLKAILERAQELYLSGYLFAIAPIHLMPLFDQKMELRDFLGLDETIVYFYFQQWANEQDPILADLSGRFVDRKLFKYVDYPAEKRELVHEKLCELFEAIGLNPAYYLLEDKLSRLPYDLYGDNGEISKQPIMLQMKDGQMKEISQVSPLVQAIATSRQTDEKLFFPQEILHDLREHANEKMQIDQLLIGSVTL